MKIQNTWMSVSVSFLIPIGSFAAEIGVLKPGPYVGVDVGASYLESTSLHQFGAPANGTVQFDTGPAFAIRGGYRFCDWFAVEGETGSVYNNIRSLTGASSVDAWVYQIPFMANAVLSIPTHSIVIPYIGGGFGGVCNVLDVNNINYFSPALGAVNLWGTDSTTTFAYQGFAGLQFAINEHMTVGVLYNYRHVNGPDWNQDFPIQFGSLRSHTGTFSFNFHF